jgi:hypothetical protein
MYMSRVWRTLKGYLFWTHDRGSFHYDVMVSLILAFIFLAPRFVDFKDQPGDNLPHRDRAGSVTAPDGTKLSVWLAPASQVDAQDEDMVRVNFERALRPVAGVVKVDRVEPVRDQSGQIVAYRAWVRK